ncbi:MAG: hypothetical protein ACOC96_00925, partial [Actinomycetota bacterium]
AAVLRQARVPVGVGLRLPNVIERHDSCRVGCNQILTCGVIPYEPGSPRRAHLIAGSGKP